MDFLHTAPGHSWPLPAVLERLQTCESGVAILLHRTEDGASLLERTLPKNGTGKPTASARKSSPASV